LALRNPAPRAESYALSPRVDEIRSPANRQAPLGCAGGSTLPPSYLLTRVLGEPCRCAVSRPCPSRPRPPRRTGLASSLSRPASAWRCRPATRSTHRARRSSCRSAPSSGPSGSKVPGPSEPRGIRGPLLHPPRAQAAAHFRRSRRNRRSAMPWPWAPQHSLRRQRRLGVATQPPCSLERPRAKEVPMARKAIFVSES
jgi:hypothetical protein